LENATIFELVFLHLFWIFLLLFQDLNRIAEEAVGDEVDYSVILWNFDWLCETIFEYDFLHFSAFYFLIFLLPFQIHNGAVSKKAKHPAGAEVPADEVEAQIDEDEVPLLSNRVCPSSLLSMLSFGLFNDISV
jgi:hypothetical protein